MQDDSSHKINDFKANNKIYEQRIINENQVIAIYNFGYYMGWFLSFILENR